MKCILCEAEGKNIFNGKVLGKYWVQYFQCPNCGLIYTEEPYWIQEAYDDSITIYDTGIMQRNVSFSILVTSIIKSIYGLKQISALDWGGGYGIFTRLMRDTGYDFRWQDKYSPCLVAKGFESNVEQKDKYDMITAFELFEHFQNPMLEIDDMFKKSDIILFSTLIYSQDMSYPELNDWWYYIPEEGQHILFYSKITLEKLAKAKGVFYYMINDSLHIFSKKRLKEKRIKRICNTKWGYILALIRWEKMRNGDSASNDMQNLLKE